MSTAHATSYGLLAATVATGLYAAYLWYQASKIRTVPQSALMGIAPFEDPTGMTIDLLMGVVKANEGAAGLNKSAARCTAIAVLIGAAENLFDHICS